MISFYDNLGATTDRYTMIVKVGSTNDHYCFSRNATAPDGVNTFNGKFDDPARINEHDQPVDWYDLPLAVQIACLQRLDPRE